MVRIWFERFTTQFSSEDCTLLGCGQIPAGCFAFEVDGVPVNVSEEPEAGRVLQWMVEELDMSLWLLENLTSWRKGDSQGAGCCCDYVEFGIESLSDGRIQLYSGFSGAPEYTRMAICEASEFWEAMEPAIDAWMALLREFAAGVPHIASPMAKALAIAQLQHVKLPKWEASYTAWCAVLNKDPKTPDSQ